MFGPTRKQSSLSITGLSPSMELVCWSVYRDFLRQHRLQNYPAKVSVTAFSKQLVLEICCGEGHSRSRYAVMTELPEAGLSENFQRELERSWNLSGGVPEESVPVAPPLPPKPAVPQVQEPADDRPRVIPMRWPRAG